MRVLDRVAVDKQDVRHMTGAELSALGVQLVDPTDLVLRCDQCGETWAPQLDSNGKLPFDYWVCPAKCNGGERSGKLRRLRPSRIRGGVSRRSEHDTYSSLLGLGKKGI